ncbi:MAG: phospholipase D-like domain-containing protein [Myxococcota bacterium]
MPSLRWVSPLFGFVLLATPATASSPVRISGVLFDGVLKGAPAPDSAVRLTNTDLKRRAPVGGFALTEAFTPTRESQLEVASAGEQSSASRTRGNEGDKARTVRLPADAELPPGGEIWIAHQASGFQEVFGFLPDFETVDTSAEVPDLDHDVGWPKLPAMQGSIALVDGFGVLIDFVAYDRNKEEKWRVDQLPAQGWRGGAVRLVDTTAYGWTGQVLARDRDAQGRLLPDTDTAADWDSGWSRKRLGVEPTHRVEIAGQSHFHPRLLRNVRARVLATSAPDNNYQALIDAFDAAQRRIRVSVYQLTNPQVAEALARRAKAGVEVQLWLEGSPVGGIPDQERYLVEALAAAGAQVYFLASDGKRGVSARYRFDHSKYVLIDDNKVIIGTENYGRTGVPVHPSYGNRGWMVHIENRDFFLQLDEVWRHDLKLGHRDVVRIEDRPDDPYGFPYRDPHFQPDGGLIQRGLYRDPARPLLVHEPMNLELVLSPDTSLHEQRAIIGMIGRARRSLYVEQNSVRRRWGRLKHTVEETPDLPLEAVVAAARRGVRTRVLLDGTWYNVTGDDDRDNDDTARFLNDLARAEGLDLSAKVINLESAHLEKIHAKGVIVDDKEVFVGSINWSENSFKGNREVGVVIGNPKVAGYYATLFRRDWAESRLYEATVRRASSVYGAPGAKAKRLGTYQPGQVVSVVGEHGGQAATGAAWLEVQTEFGNTAYLRAADVVDPVATAREALHLLGREATVTGRVAMTRVSPKVIQLRFDDDERPPFVAVIFKASEEHFEKAGVAPTSAFQGREVRVRGLVQAYKQPEIVVRGPEQIEILR